MPSIDFLQAATEGARTGIAIGSYLRETGRQADQNFATQYALGQAGVESILRVGQTIAKQNQLKFDNQLKQQQMAQEDMRIGQAQARLEQQAKEEERRATLDQLRYNAQLANQNADNRRADTQLGLSIGTYNQNVAEANRERQREQQIDALFGLPVTPEQATRPDFAPDGIYGTPAYGAEGPAPGDVLPLDPPIGASLLPPPPANAEFNFDVPPDNAPMSAGLLGDASPPPRSVDTSTLPPPPQFGGGAASAPPPTVIKDTAIASAIGQSQNSVADASKLTDEQLDVAEIGAAKLASLAGSDGPRRLIAYGARNAVELVKRQRLAEAKARDEAAGKKLTPTQRRDIEGAKNYLEQYTKEAVSVSDIAYPGVPLADALIAASTYSVSSILGTDDLNAEQKAKVRLKALAKQIEAAAKDLNITTRQALEQYSAKTLDAAVETSNGTQTSPAKDVDARSLLNRILGK